MSITNSNQAINQETNELCKLIGLNPNELKPYEEQYLKCNFYHIIFTFSYIDPESEDNLDGILTEDFTSSISRPITDADLTIETLYVMYDKFLKEQIQLFEERYPNVVLVDYILTFNYGDEINYVSVRLNKEYPEISDKFIHYIDMAETNLRYKLKHYNRLLIDKGLKNV